MKATSGGVVSLGQIDVPSGMLLIVDPGLGRYWSHDADPAITDRAPSHDLRLTGIDAVSAGKAFDRQFDPRFLYDVSGEHLRDMQAAFASFCRERKLNASTEVLKQRAPHVERARLAVEAGEGIGVVQYAKLWGVIVGGLPSNHAIAIRGVLMEPGEFEGRWRRLEAVIDEHAVVASSQSVDGVMVEHGQFLFSDLDAFGQFRMWHSLDGLGDFIFWGADAEALAAEVQAPRLNEREFGWKNMALEELHRLAERTNEAIGASGWKVAQDFRPHDNLERLNSQIRTNELRAGSLVLGGQRVVGMDNRWGDGVFTVVRDLDSAGRVVRVRIETGSEQRQELMRSVAMQWKFAIVTRRIVEGEPIRFAERTEPNNDQDSGWLFSSGAETQTEMEDAKCFKLMPLHEVLGLAPTLSEFLCHPVGTLLKRVGNDFVEE